MKPRAKFIVALVFIAIGFLFLCNRIEGLIAGIFFCLGAYLVVDTFYQWPETEKHG